MDPLEPQPPRSIPPAPPRPEWIKPAPFPPSAPGTGGAPLTPMMEFFSRRIEALERELTSERERAQSAQTLLAQQDTLKSEVDAHLRSLSDQLKREKSERDGEESRTHARGRIDALEKRLDEMNATFAQLLKDAISSRESGPSSGALAAELSAFRGALKDGMDGISRWRGELRELAAVVPAVESLAQRIPEDEKRFEGEIGRRLDDFAARLARSLDDWLKLQDAGRAEIAARLEAVERERTEMARLWETQSRGLREEQFKDRVARDAETARGISEIAMRLEELAAAQGGAARGAGEAKTLLERVLTVLTQTPKAKDALIEELEGEKAELMAVLSERQEALRRFAVERRAVEKSMGDGLMRLTSDLEEERARTRTAEARAAANLGEIETLKARLADAERSIAERDARSLGMAAERDELARALVAEADKVRRALEERRAFDAESEARLAELRKRVEEEGARRASAEGAAADARAQMGALAEQSGRALRERDSVVARFADWEAERRRLLDVVRKKDEMITLLSATFQGALGKKP